MTKSEKREAHEARQRARIATYRLEAVDDSGKAVHDSLGPCLAFGCETLQEALEVFADSFGALADRDLDGDAFTVFADAVLRGITDDAQLEQRLDALRGEFG